MSLSTVSNTLASQCRRIVADAYQLLEGRLPALARFDDRHRPPHPRDLDYIVRYADMALVVDDPSLFTHFIDWLTRFRTTRGLPATVMDDPDLGTGRDRALRGRSVAILTWVHTEMPMMRASTNPEKP